MILKSSKGVAIVLVVVMVALASVIVLNLTYSAFLSNRSVGLVERQLQSEYILKSLLNFSMTLLANDFNTYDSYQDDAWGLFATAPRVPNSLLGIRDQNVEIYLEIIPRNSKLNLTQLADIPSSQSRESKNANMEFAENLFKLLGFDEQEEENQLPIMRGKIFKSTDLVANLVDWQDRNAESFRDPFYQGVEGDLDHSLVLNEKISLMGQLALVPGFSSRRISAMAPYVIVHNNKNQTTGYENTINFNTAGRLILQSLDSRISGEVAQQIQEYIATNGPFKTKADIQTANILPAGVYERIQPLIAVKSSSFDIYGKVKYGLQRSYYVKAIVNSAGSGTRPILISASYF